MKLKSPDAYYIGDDPLDKHHMAVEENVLRHECDDFVSTAAENILHHLAFAFSFITIFVAPFFI